VAPAVHPGQRATDALVGITGEHRGSWIIPVRRPMRAMTRNSMREVNPVFRGDRRDRGHVRTTLAAEFRGAALKEDLEAGG
jgi:hypothetical protein